MDFWIDAELSCCTPGIFLFYLDSTCSMHSEKQQCFKGLYLTRLQLRASSSCTHQPHGHHHHTYPRILFEWFWLYFNYVLVPVSSRENGPRWWWSSCLFQYILLWHLKYSWGLHFMYKHLFKRMKLLKIGLSCLVFKFNRKVNHRVL